MVFWQQCPVWGLILRSWWCHFSCPGGRYAMTVFVAASTWQRHVLLEWSQKGSLSWQCLLRRAHDSAMSYLSEARKAVSHDSVRCSEHMTVPCPSWVKPERQSLMTVFVAASTWQRHVLLEWNQKGSLSWQCLLQRAHDSAVSFLSEARKPVSHDSVCCSEHMTAPCLPEWRRGACLQFIIKPWQCLLQRVHNSATSCLSEDGEPVYSS